MSTNPIIRRILAGLLLLLFGLSITPKKTLHDFFAHHKDIASSSVDGPGTNKKQYSIAGFNCHCENQVVESPFVGAAFRLQPDEQADWYIRYGRTRDVFHQPVSRYYELRGPPAL